MHGALVAGEVKAPRPLHSGLLCCLCWHFVLVVAPASVAVVVHRDSKGGGGPPLQPMFSVICPRVWNPSHLCGGMVGCLQLIPTSGIHSRTSSRDAAPVIEDLHPVSQSTHSLCHLHTLPGQVRTLSLMALLRYINALCGVGWISNCIQAECMPRSCNHHGDVGLHAGVGTYRAPHAPYNWAHPVPCALMPALN